jgi:hypothetical protein
MRADQLFKSLNLKIICVGRGVKYLDGKKYFLMSPVCILFDGTGPAKGI